MCGDNIRCDNMPEKERPMSRILRIDASARTTGSITRDLTDRIVARLGGAVTARDLATPLPLIDADWVAANFTPAGKRSPEQAAALALSDTLVAELSLADTIVIGVPVYNFAVPAALKAWTDLVVRAGVTFRYCETGPEGLLVGKRAILAMASGGTQAGSDIDFATGYMRHILGFMGTADVQMIAVDGMSVDPEGTLKAAHGAIEAMQQAA